MTPLPPLLQPQLCSVGVDNAYTSERSLIAALRMVEPSGLHLLKQREEPIGNMGLLSLSAACMSVCLAVVQTETQAGKFS